jgi:hypothetical protein
MARKCPVCGKVSEEDMIRLCEEAQGWIIDTIRRAHPDWVEKDGSCSKCLEYYKKLGKSENGVK